MILVHHIWKKHVYSILAINTLSAARIYGNLYAHGNFTRACALISFVRFTCKAAASPENQEEERAVTLRIVQTSVRVSAVVILLDLGE